MIDVSSVVPSRFARVGKINSILLSMNFGGGSAGAIKAAFTWITNNSIKSPTLSNFGNIVDSALESDRGASEVRRTARTSVWRRSEKVIPHG